MNDQNPIHQLSVRYLAEQDRLLVSVRTPAGAEVRLWLTRRLALRLSPLLRQAAGDAAARSAPQVADTAARRALAEFERDAALQQSDFATPYQGQAADPAPGDTGPLLVTEAQLTVLPAGALRLALHERLPGQPARSMQLDLMGTLVHGFVQLVQQGLAAADWGDGPGAPPPAVAAPAPYLN